jgi:hypothetical protein
VVPRIDVADLHLRARLMAFLHHHYGDWFVDTCTHTSVAIFQVCHPHTYTYAYHYHVLFFPYAFRWIMCLACVVWRPVAWDIHSFHERRQLMNYCDIIMID